MQSIHDNFRATIDILPLFVVDALKPHSIENVDEIILE